MFKKIFFTFCIAFSILITPAFASDSGVVDQSDEYYVADYADVLSEYTEEEIISTNASLEEMCSDAQIVVVTVDNLGGMYSDEYAVTLFNNWGVGSSTENNGMLLLLVPGENKGWLATGSGIDDSFTDDMANEYLNKYFWDDFDDGAYDDAVNSLFPELVAWYEDYYDVTVSSGFSGSGSGTSLAESLIGGFVILLIVVILVIIFLSAWIIDRMNFRRYYIGLGMPIPRYHFWYMFGFHGGYHHRGGPYSPGGHGGGFGGHAGGGGGRGPGGGPGGGGLGGGGGGHAGGGGGGRR